MRLREAYGSRHAVRDWGGMGHLPAGKEARSAREADELDQAEGADGAHTKEPGRRSMVGGWAVWAFEGRAFSGVARMPGFGLASAADAAPRMVGRPFRECVWMGLCCARPPRALALQMQVRSHKTAPPRVAETRWLELQAWADVRTANPSHSRCHGV